jgi:hypothetical protein
MDGLQPADGQGSAARQWRAFVGHPPRESLRNRRQRRPADDAAHAAGRERQSSPWAKAARPEVHAGQGMPSSFLIAGRAGTGASQNVRSIELIGDTSPRATALLQTVPALIDYRDARYPPSTWAPTSP